MARVLLACWGSYGDLFPYLAIADALRALGHTPVVASCPYYADLVGREGLSFRPVRPDVQPDDPALLARSMDPRRGTGVVVREILVPAVRDNFADLAAAHPWSIGKESGAGVYSAVAQTSRSQGRRGVPAKMTRFH